MVNFVATGGAFRTPEFGSNYVPFNYAGASILDSRDLGISGNVLLGVHVCERRLGYDFSCAGRCADANASDGPKRQLPMGQVKPVMTALGGGVAPLSIKNITDTFGHDVCSWAAQYRGIRWAQRPVRRRLCSPVRRC